VTVGGHPRFFLDGVRASKLRRRFVLDAGQRLLKGQQATGMTFLTSAGVARRFGINVSTVVRAVRAGKLKPSVVTAGGHYRFASDSLVDVGARLGIASPSAVPILPEPELRRPRWKRRTSNLHLGVRLLMVAAAIIALLPFLALARGALIAMRAGFNTSTLDVSVALVALVLGSFFFLYSIKYYLGTLVVLLTAVVLGTRSRRVEGHTNGDGDRRPRLRFIPRRNGNGNGHSGANGIKKGNGNGEGHLDLGYQPFVSIHIATYNEKRVIGRLLEGCAALDYGHYEVVVVDDSTDETAEILNSWKSHPRFKIVHRPNRDGFKGGALQVALEHMDPKADFVIVWDADSVPFPDSIQTFLPHFFHANGNGNGHGNGNGSVWRYQWHILNKSESWLTESVRAEYAGSYMVERPFQEAVGSLKMVAGTAYMIRADLLHKLGWGRSLTEDWELTLKLYALGFKIVYTPYAESPAECVGTFGRLARQRMRWAEGHSYNVRRRFGQIMRSSRLGFVEKIEFLFYTTYYLQAALFIVGTGAWLIAEIILHAHVPEWTALLGWSLLFTNLLSLPVMNLSGLLLEDAPAKDFVGVLGALATSFLLVPFQAYAAIKGFIERDEGPWYRTPKTGRITDPVQRLRRLDWLRRWLFGPGPSRLKTPQAVHATSTSTPPRQARRLAWVAIGALALALSGVGLGALRAPVVEAVGTSVLYLHRTPFAMDEVVPAGSRANLSLTMGLTQTWATPVATAASQTIFAGTTFTFNYFTTVGSVGTVTVTLRVGYSATSTCPAVTNLIAQTSDTLTSGGPLSTASFSPASAVTVPINSFFCFTITVTGVGAPGLTLHYDGGTLATTNLTSSQTIFIPEFLLPFIGLAVLAPLVGRLRRRQSPSGLAS
jgi:cellulose synthase/poly-beta-1,6-N-acetylglucosamine synthase-like glycosyltransferase